jgi:PilZ domain
VGRWDFPVRFLQLGLETNRGKLLVCGDDTTERASRMNEDRRHATRVRVNFPARWEGLMDQNEATICDISITGCMVLSGGEVTSGELIRLEIQFPNGEWAYQWGEVAYPVPEIGFALRFTDLTEEEKRRLQKLIDLSNSN